MYTAKLANHAAKRYPATEGVVDLTDGLRRQRLRAITPVDAVWGIGGRLRDRFARLGIETAEDLARANPSWLRRHFSVVVERTARELNGTSCLELEEITPLRQQIICSRSFGARITICADMRQAVARYAARAAERLRGEGQRAGAVVIPPDFSVAQK